MLTAEMETTITYDSEEKLVRIFSARGADQTKLKRAGITPYMGSATRGYFYRLPLTHFSWQVRKEARKKKVLPPNHPFRLRGAQRRMAMETF